MAVTQMNKMVWVVETIYKAGRISFEDLNRKWMDNTDLSGGEEILKRTFHKWRDSILDTFGLIIDCEKGGSYRYYISNPSVLRNGSMESWLMSTFSVSNSLMGSKSIKDRIILEDIPSGLEHLDSIINAMKKSKLIHITYYNYWRGDTRQHYVMPLCVKLFRQRWYMVGKAWTTGYLTIYSLDRIREFRLSSHSFDFPEDFEPQEYFRESFGVITGIDTKAEQVVLKVSAGQANYLRNLPMHETLIEKERHDDYSLFELVIRPTFDFQQEILWNGEDMEVLSPEWLRKEIARKIKRMWNKYKED